MKIKKKIARYLLKEFKKGFQFESELKFWRKNLIALCENKTITKKDCRILTDYLFDYEIDNFYTFEI